MPNPMRKHDRSHFYKFSSFSTAMKVLKSQSFRWSSPLKFNDPFDSQTPLTAEINESEFADVLSEAYMKAVYSDIPIDKTYDVGLFKKLENYRVDRGILNKDKLVEAIKNNSLISASRLNSSFENFNDTILKQISHSRVFCVSEIIDNTVMWSHYAEQHEGVAFRLGCIDELDNLLLIAKKVNYVESFLKFPDATEYANHLTGLKTIDMLALATSIPFIKHKDWEYEKEWRVHIPMLDKPEGDGVDYQIENMQIFEELYLGCNIKMNNAMDIVTLAKSRFPNMKIYQAKRSNKRFGLYFESID
jgi:Protein of unknown function (DUF2971)